jgi:hypothetical protein
MTNASSNLAVPSGGGSANIIQVIGAGTDIAKHIITYLAQYSAEMVAAGITGIYIAVDKAIVTVHTVRRQGQADYAIKLTVEFAQKFSRAMDYIDGNVNIRPSIQQKALAELDFLLDELYRQIRQEMSHNPFA